MARTDDAERVAAYMVQKLLLAENAYLGPKFRNTHLEKEVADLLLVHRDQALVVQMKCQEDPDTRSGDKLSSWVERKARSAYKQLLGTVGTLRERDYWCTHPTLGLVNFTRGQLTPVHCIVVVEHRAQSISIPATLPLNARGVPVTYFTLSDFINCVTELRTFCDFCGYLDARGRLSNFDLRLTGCEEPLVGHYMLHNGSFPAGLTQEQRLAEINERQADFESFISQKDLGNAHCEVVEAAARALSKRAAGYPPRHPDNKGYRIMQEVLMDLTYAERRLVGAKIEQAVSQLRSMPEKLQEAQVVSYVVMRHSEPAIFVSASRRVSPELAHDSCLKLMELADRYIAPTSHILTVRLNLLEARIQYWFSLLPLSNTRDRPLDDSGAGSAPPEWIAFTPDTRF